MRLRCTLWLLVATVGVAFPEKGTAMNSDLTELIVKKDWGAVELAQKAGPRAVAEVEPYLKNPDPVVRVLAVDCLNAAGGPKVPDLFIRALGDVNEQVRINAVNALHVHLPSGREAALLAAWDGNRTRDGYVRQQVPMVLGRMAARGTIPELHRRIALDQRQEVKDGLIAGLARMGDAPARTEFGALLRDARGKRTAEVMELVRYLDEPWVIPLLVPVLERRDIAVDLSTHRKTVLRRECDLAVDEVLRISKGAVAVPLDEIAQYTDAQIAEVLRYARAQAR
jgi:hypothetical protein